MSDYLSEVGGKKKREALILQIVIGGTIALFLIGGGVAAALVFREGGEKDVEGTREASINTTETTKPRDTNVLEFGLFMLSDLLLVILYSQSVNIFSKL